MLKIISSKWNIFLHCSEVSLFKSNRFGLLTLIEDVPIKDKSETSSSSSTAPNIAISLADIFFTVNNNVATLLTYVLLNIKI